MESIVACRDTISERFPVASFTINVPGQRYYEVACATDPRLFHTDNAARRSQQNFYTSRSAGLLAARPGSNTFMLPPEQLRRFAGARRLYYALGTYGGPRGEHPRFSISPEGLDTVPSVAVAADFTGRSLDRRRLGVGATKLDTPSYGNARVLLRWGGDVVLEAERTARARLLQTHDGVAYDDGYGALPVLEPTTSGGELLRAGDLAGDTQVGIERPSHGEAYYGRPAARPAAQRHQDHHGYEGYEDGAAARAAARVRPLLVARHSYGGRCDAKPASCIEDGAQARAQGRARALPRPSSTASYGRVEPLIEDGAQARVYGRARALSQSPRAQTRARTLASPRSSYRARGRHPLYHELAYEESLAIGPAVRALGVEPSTATGERVALTIPEKVRILRIVGRAESGDDGYAAIYADGEFNDPNHPFHGRTHVGLSFGFLLFTQRGGALGRVLKLAKQREPALAAAGQLAAEQRFDALFGEHADALLERTDPERTTDPEARIAPVGGAPLWVEPWLARFRAAGAVPHVQAAQNQVAVEDYFDPALPLAAALGLDTARGLALIVDRLVHMGVGAGSAWIMSNAGPIRDEATRDRALAELGHTNDLAGFRRARSLAGEGWDARVHAELCRALRERGSTSVALPDRAASLAALSSAADSSDFAERVRALISNRSDFDDAIAFELG